MASTSAFSSPILKNQLAQIGEGAEFTFKDGKLAVTYLAADIKDLGITFGLEAGKKVWDQSEVDGFKTVWSALETIDG